MTEDECRKQLQKVIELIPDGYGRMNLEQRKHFEESLYRLTKMNGVVSNG